jgi:general secretion pathway protein G
VVVSFGVALLVLGISINVAWREYFSSTVLIEVERTLRDIASVQRAVEGYRDENGALPETLRGLAPADGPHFATNEAGDPVDFWERPLDYWADGDQYRITSYGRDGRPGGTGLEHDLSNDDLDDETLATDAWPRSPDYARPTFWQFLTDRGSPKYVGAGSRMAAACLVAAAVALILSLQALGATMPDRRPVRARVERIIIAVVVALVMALFMAIAHAPSGH